MNCTTMRKRKKVVTEGVCSPFHLPKYDLFGIAVSGIAYHACVEAIIQAAKSFIPGCVSALAVHGLMIGTQDYAFKTILNDFEILAPDGQPVRFALNILYNLNLLDRIYGPELMLRVCERAMSENIGIYLYGSYPHVVIALRKTLNLRFPHLRIVGCEASIFRRLTEAEDEALIRRVNDSGAGVLFLGLGCPLQENFAYAHRGKIRPVQVCVGAAFDFYAGNKRMAPAWMQLHGLEWLFRLMQEPKRLWRRYLSTNSLFIIKLLIQAWHLNVGRIAKHLRFQ